MLRVKQAHLHWGIWHTASESIPIEPCWAFYVKVDSKIAWTARRQAWLQSCKLTCKKLGCRFDSERSRFNLVLHNHLWLIAFHRAPSITFLNRSLFAFSWPSWHFWPTRSIGQASYFLWLHSWSSLVSHFTHKTLYCGILFKPALEIFFILVF
jgi:hypothetical protein